MISHVHVGIADFDRAFAFYDPVLPVLGLALRVGDPARGWAGWQTPGPRPHYHADCYGAYVRDPEGNELCICCHQPEATP